MVTYWEFLGSWGGTEELKSSKQWTQMWTELVKLHKDSNTSLGLTILDLDRRHLRLLNGIPPTIGLAVRIPRTLPCDR